MMFTRASESSPVTHLFIVMTSEYYSLLEKKMHITYPLTGKWHYSIVLKNILIVSLLDPIVELEK